MNLALIGYGNMGKEIESLASEKNISIKKIFTRKNNSLGKGITKRTLKDVDICIEFTAPNQAYSNIEAIVKCGKNVVCGTTGWLSKMNNVKSLVEKYNVGFLYAANFSIGVNIFSQVMERAAQLFNKFEEYDVFLNETHHVSKPDSPSGTALALASILLENYSRKKEIISETAHTILQPYQLHVSSTRSGQWIGQHKVVFDSEADVIELVHTARSRKGYALGALLAAEWLKDKRGFFTMKDVLQ